MKADRQAEREQVEALVQRQKAEDREARELKKRSIRSVYEANRAYGLNETQGSGCSTRKERASAGPNGNLF